MEAFSMRQQALSTNLDRLTETTDYLSTKHIEHANAITSAQNMTEEILEILEGVAGTAARIEEADRSRWGGMGLRAWVPYIISPVATILLGNYGLSPSVSGNLGLAALGELLWFSVSHLNQLTVPWGLGAFSNIASNTTMTMA